MPRWRKQSRQGAQGKKADQSAQPYADWLLLGAGSVLVVLLSGYLQLDLNAPASLRGDHIFILENARSYIDGAGFRYDQHLGFPEEKDSFYFPSFDLSQRVLLFLVARFTRDPFLAVHVFYGACLIAMYASTYVALRWLCVARSICFVAPIGYVISPFLMQRAYGHDFLALYYSAPLGAALALGLGLRSRNPKRADALDPFIVVSVIVVSTSGIYYLFFTLLFLLLVSLSRSIAEKTARPLFQAALIVAVSGCLLLFSGYGLEITEAMNSNYRLPGREPFEQLFYGLSLPSAGSLWAWVPEVGPRLESAMQAAPEFFSMEGVDEWPGLVLTAVLLSSPLIVCVAVLRGGTPNDANSSESRGPAVPALAAVCCCVGLLFGLRGGLGFLFNLLLEPGIRAQSRIMPFLSFFALVILCSISGRILRREAWFLAWGGYALIWGSVLWSAAPSLGGLAHKQMEESAQFGYHQKQATYSALAKARSAAGLHRILQLPVLPWPETLPVNGFEAYDHELPFVFEPVESDVRYSYGASRTQGAYGIARDLERDLPVLVPKAAGVGFDGVLIEKAAYSPLRLQAIQKAIADQLDSSCEVYNDELLVLFSLRIEAGAGGKCLGNL